MFPQRLKALTWLRFFSERGFTKHYTINIIISQRKSYYRVQYSKLEHYASQPRLDRFLQACDNSKSKTQDLYRLNLQVSQAFYPVLNLFEIFLRNMLNYKLSGYFSDPNWIRNQKNGFMDDSSLENSRFFLKKCVVTSEKLILKKGGTVSSDKVIAEQSMSFWTSLFDVHHYRLIGGIPIQCFVHKPKSVNRSSISQKLNQIRSFRNRVYHNEPICFYEDAVNFKQSLQIQSNIYLLLSWIDSDLVEYVQSYDSINSKIKNIELL